MKKIAAFFTIITLLLLIVPSVTNSQCAMCKSNLESARHNGNNAVGNTINNGILYLFVLPYAIAGIFGFIYYRKHKSAKSKQNAA
jgi:hypothetical protein